MCFDLFGAPRIELGPLLLTEPRTCLTHSVIISVGAPRIELGLLDPKSSVLPVYYAPEIPSIPFLHYTD